MINDYKILNILMVLFSTQIVKTYIDSFHDNKKPFNVMKHLTWGVYIFFQYWVMISSASDPLLVLTINIALIFLIYKTSYYIHAKTALFLSGILYAIWMLTEVAVNNILHLAIIEETSYFFIVGSVASKLIMYTAVHFLKRCRKSNLLTDVPFLYWVRLFLIPVATFYIIHNTYQLTSPSGNTFFFTITTILLIIVNYITFDVYDRLGNHMEIEKRNLVYEQQLALCNKQAAEREIAYQETRRVRHDLNGYLVDLKAAIQSGRIEEAELKIDHILKQNQIYRNEVSRSGNLVIDALINYKYSLTQKEGIDMKCYVLIPEQIPFEGADLCIILGNLIDNAMEAVTSLPERQRYMEVSVSQVKGNLSIMVKNPYEGDIKRNGSGQIQTSKQDSLNHGIGLSSVKRSVDKYNGELLTEYRDGMFKATVLLYPPENLHDSS